ncbi:hypothetical protein T484DRAFT_1770330 [Baffinella frigidus]|nr:hypothetical protein T484DRAFT_1770330 [Cryptophyta sp. CCMP2293]
MAALKIRAHCAHLGHPLVRDTRYYSSKWKRQCSLTQEYLWVFLHALRVRVPDLEGGFLEASAPLPPELQAVLDSLPHAPPATFDPATFDPPAATFED